MNYKNALKALTKYLGAAPAAAPLATKFAMSSFLGSDPNMALEAQQSLIIMSARDVRCMRPEGEPPKFPLSAIGVNPVYKRFFYN